MAVLGSILNITDKFDLPTQIRVKRPIWFSEVVSVEFSLDFDVGTGQFLIR